MQRNLAIESLNPQGHIADPSTRGVVAANDIKPNVPLHEILAGWSISHQDDKGEELGGGKPRRISRRCRRHKMKRTKKRHSSKKIKTDVETINIYAIIKFQI
jgi:hypothetical protein